MPTQHRKGSGGTKKYGRNRIKCLKYSQRNQKIKNKIRKLKKVSKIQPNNKQVIRRLEELCINAS